MIEYLCVLATLLVTFLRITWFTCFMQSDLQLHQEPAICVCNSFCPTITHLMVSLPLTLHVIHWLAPGVNTLAYYENVLWPADANATSFNGDWTWHRQTELFTLPLPCQRHPAVMSRCTKTPVRGQEAKLLLKKSLYPRISFTWFFWHYLSDFCWQLYHCI